MTRDGERTCGNSHPAFSFDARFFAYLQERPVAGSCENPEPIIKIRDRTNGSTRVVDQVQDLFGFEMGVNRSRIDFLADGRGLMFWASGYCGQTWAIIDAVDGSWDWVDNAGCGTNVVYGEAFPYPSGRNSVEHPRIPYTTPPTDGDMQPVPR